MTDQTKPSQGAVPAEPASDASVLKLLVELMLAERQEAMQDKAERKRANQARDEQRKVNAEYSKKQKETIQAMCPHKKGGKLQSPRTDYALYHHTFTDQTTYIRCQICGMKWRKVDTEEFLIRKGQKIPNHTGIGWKEALRMLGQSTNTPSSSEVQVNTIPIATAIGELE